MTVVARRFLSIPERTASATWTAISALLAPDENSAAAVELHAIAGLASSLISREAMTSPLVVWGVGPRVRIYCLYNEDAIEGDDANETSLTFNPTDGDWNMSLPCPSEDLEWIKSALKAKSQRVTARDMESTVDEEEDSDGKRSAEAAVDLEAFFKS